MLIRSFSRSGPVYEAEGTGGGGTPPAPTPNPAPTPTEPRTYTADYVHGVREEAKSHRLRAVEAEGKLAAAEKALQDATNAATTAATAANTRLINAELRGAARVEGIVDLDALRLLDISAITLSDQGEVVIPEGFWAKAREAKPWMFGTATPPAPVVPGTTGNPARPPAPAAPGTKHVRDMSAAEADAEERRLLGRR